MSRFRLTCPVCCGGVITPWGRTAEGNHRGHCAHCYQRVTVTVHAEDILQGVVNKDAPFYGLVMLVDQVANARISPEPVRSSTGVRDGYLATIDVMESA